MPKSEELKARIDYLRWFLTILLSIIVVISGGLFGLYLNDQINEVFWLGIGTIIFLSLLCFGLTSKIENRLKELGEA
uniref:Uncharacterized protein n=1 Tax=Candidatus Kentrum sp. DK TaxID=2126562 RepID=A0A450SEV4_9GAMM|nr:MAG: hypothetical protein BECKDK2373B_GA0170837_103231 [Candidatus Kentron sp. DK]